MYSGFSSSFVFVAFRVSEAVKGCFKGDCHLMLELKTSKSSTLAPIMSLSSIPIAFQAQLLPFKQRVAGSGTGGNIFRRQFLVAENKSIKHHS